MYRKYDLLLISLFFLLVSCIPADPGVTSATNPTVPPTAPIAATHTAPPPTAAVTRVNDFGVRFQYPTELGPEVLAQVVEAFTDDQGMNYLLQPQHIAFTFPNSYAEGEPLFHRYLLNLETLPQIVVYAAAEYAATHELAHTQVDQLQALLATRPETPGGTLPYLPLNNAAQVLHSRPVYLDFANGSGVRYLMVFSQDVSPITNQQLLYTFQGLTDDGQYYVAAYFPVITAALPDSVQVEDYESFAVNYWTYVADTKAALDQLDPAWFTPDLALLDALVTSLDVTPQVDLAAGQTSVGQDELAVIKPTLLYQLFDDDSALYHLIRIYPDGLERLLAEAPFPLFPAPDAAHAAYMDDDLRLWLVDLASGTEEELAVGTDLADSFVWGDADTLLVGVVLSPAGEEGPPPGHLATLEIAGGVPVVIAEDYPSFSPAAMAPDGQQIAYDLSPYSGVTNTARLYRPGPGSEPLDPANYTGMSGTAPWHLFNPSWSPDGRQLAWLYNDVEGSHLMVFDLVRQTAMIVLSWQPAQFGALPPAPTWSGDGKWLAIEVWANNAEESGLWVLPADGTFARLHLPTGHQPLWINATQLIYADLDENRNGALKLHDIEFGEMAVLDLPQGSMVMLWGPD